MKKQYKISIPQPCNEDWNKMSRTEQGRFCGVCSKNLIDFTNKSALEIQEILLKNIKNKVCGRFTKEQLNTIHIEIPVDTFRKQYFFTKTFAIALLLVMGTTLLSCNTDGKTRKIETVIVVGDSNKKINKDIDNDGIPNEFDVDYIEPSKTKTKVSKKTTETCKTDSLKKQNLLKTKKRILKIPDIKTHRIVGMIRRVEPKPDSVKIPKLPLEKTLKQDIELAVLGRKPIIEITKHFCNSNPRIRVNYKTILFSDFYKKVKGKKIKIKNFNILKNDKDCISTIQLKYKVLFEKLSIPKEINTTKDSILDKEIIIKKKDAIAKEINFSEKISKVKDTIKEK